MAANNMDTEHMQLMYLCGIADTDVKYKIGFQ